MKKWIRTELRLFRGTPAIAGDTLHPQKRLNPLKIGFMTTLGVNVGDEFIREGIRAILDRIGIPYQPLYVNKHDPQSVRKHYQDEPISVQDKYWDCDIFIQAGAPVYWHLHGGRSKSVTSEWHKWLWQERILNSTRPAPMFLNLGAGSCQPWQDNGQSFLADSECRGFARAAGQRSTLTTVRDEIASRILRKLHVRHERLCCPAFLAASRHRPANTQHGLIGINLMPLGAHYDLRENFDRDRWKTRCEKLCHSLRQLGRLVFIAHDPIEVEFSKQWARPDEGIFIAGDWQSYLDVYSSCQMVVANRVHGAVCSAGFGVPSIIMGNDTRARIGEYLGLPVLCSADLNLNKIMQHAVRLMTYRSVESERLLKLRDGTLARYEQLLAPLLSRVADRNDALLARSA